MMIPFVKEGPPELTSWDMAYPINSVAVHSHTFHFQPRDKQPINYPIFVPIATSKCRYKAHTRPGASKTSNAIKPSSTTSASNKRNPHQNDHPQPPPGNANSRPHPRHPHASLRASPHPQPAQSTTKTPPSPIPPPHRASPPKNHSRNPPIPPQNQSMLLPLPPISSPSAKAGHHGPP